jgi:hypothetical protein
MPGFDGTGPAGMGPMTGGARGPCNPYDAPRAAGYGYRPSYPAYGAYPRAFGGGRPRWGMGRGAFGRGGRGRGRGGGRGRGRW